MNQNKNAKENIGSKDEVTQKIQQSMKKQQADSKHKIYLYFPNYSHLEINHVIKKLPQEEQELIYLRYGKDLKGCHKVDNKIYLKLVRTIFSHIRKLLEGNDLNIRKTYKGNVYQKFSDYSEEEVNVAVSQLSQEEQNLLSLRYGKDLKEYHIVDKKICLKINGTVFSHIRKRLEENKLEIVDVELTDHHQITKEEEDKKIEQQITHHQKELELSLTVGLETKKLQEVDCIHLCKLFHHPIFEKLIKEEMTKEELIVFTLVSGVYSGKCFSIDRVAKFFDLDPSVVLKIQQKGLHLIKNKTIEMIDQEIKEELQLLSSGYQKQKGKV